MLSGIVVSLEAQISYGGSPISSDILSSENVPVVELVCAPSVKSVMNKSTAPSRLKINDENRVCPVNTSCYTGGKWDTLNSGAKVWRIALHHDNTAYISIIFSKYRLERGVRLFLYDQERTQVLGAYTHQNNKSYGSFAVSPVYSETVYIELQVERGVTSPGDLEIGIAGIDLNEPRTPQSRKKDEFYRNSGSCNVDVNCKEDPEIQQQKHSVVRIIYLGHERCTGTLVNNTRQNGYPYILTAQHCINTQSLARGCIFYFNYESPYCNGPDGSVQQSISGAKLVATTDNNIDFSLLDMSEYPPFYYHPYYSAWDARNIPAPTSYSIHHPWGDVKKISIESHPLVTGDFGEGYDSNTHWVVSHWEEGTTEKGSSGAGLFNQDNRLVGTLSGGDAYCGFSYNDFFQKFYNEWDDYPNPENQLKFWLDPVNTGANYLDGYDPYYNFWISGDTLSNIDNQASTGILAAGEWGFMSGNSSDSASVFAEHFLTDDSTYLIGAFLNVGRSYASTDSSKIMLNVYEGGSLPGKILYSKEIYLYDLIEGTLNLVNLDTFLLVGNDFYIGYEVFYNNTDIFAINTNLELQPENTAYVKYNTNWITLKEFTHSTMNLSLDIRPLVFATLPSLPKPDVNLLPGDALIYPVPAYKNIKILFWEVPETDLKISFINTAGQVVDAEIVKRPDIIMDYNVGKLQPGLYVVQLIINNFIINKKIVILDK